MPVWVVRHEETRWTDVTSRDVMTGELMNQSMTLEFILIRTVTELSRPRKAVRIVDQRSFF